MTSKVTTLNPECDLDRLRVEYADRHERLAGSDVYSLFNQANLFAVHQRQRVVLKVLRRHGYDFWLNPTNPQTRGIRPKEIRRLFPNCRYEFHRITLAPPLARRIVPISWLLAATLEKLWVLNTHYLVAIRRRQ